MQIFIWTPALHVYCEEYTYILWFHAQTYRNNSCSVLRAQYCIDGIDIGGASGAFIYFFLQPCLSNTSRQPFMDVHFYTGIFDLSFTNNYTSYQYILITIIPSNTMIVYSNILSRKIEWELNLSICQNLWVVGFFASFLLDFFLIFIFLHLLKDYSSAVLTRHWQIWVIRLKQDRLFVLINF